MQALSFKLSGKTACFRKPDVNQYAYFTYNNIHKPALLGLFGAVLGLKGYSQLYNEKATLDARIKTLKAKEKKEALLQRDALEQKLPEFYESLQHLKISIIPLAKYGYFSKKLQVFNNSVGYASKEEGGNLIVREQWLEEPVWQILVLDDGSEIFQKLKQFLEEGKAVYVPYLGKNEHFANFEDVTMFSLNEALEKSTIASLFQERHMNISKLKPTHETSYFFKEYAPTRLQETYHFYEYESLVFTNHKIKEGDLSHVYSYAGNNYAFI